MGKVLDDVLSKVVFINTKEHQNHFDLMILESRYGTTYYKFENERLYNIFLKNVEILNILQKDICDLEPAMITDFETNGDYKDVLIPGVFSFLWRARTIEPLRVIPLNDEDNIDILAKRALDSKQDVKLKIRKPLHKHAKKIANQYGVKFVVSGDECFFSCAEKRMSVYSRIQKAIADGLDYIEFSEKEVSAPTVRVYVSGMNTSGSNFSVSTVGNKITVYLKKKPENHVNYNKLIKAFNAVSVEVGHEKALNLTLKLYNEQKNKFYQEDTEQPYNPDTGHPADDEHDETEEFRYLSQIDDKFASQETEDEDEGYGVTIDNPEFGEKIKRIAENIEQKKIEQPYEISEVTGYRKIKLPPELENEQPLTEEDLSWVKSVRPEPKTYYNPDADGSNFINDPDFQPNEQGEFWATVDGKRVWMDDMGDYISEAEKLERDSRHEDDDF